MKNLLHIIFIILPIILTAQNWTLINTNTTNEISSICFKDEELGFFVTGAGEIFRSQDSGDSWELIYHHPEMIWGNLVTTNDSLIWYTRDNTIPTRVAFSLETFDFTKETIDILPFKPKFWKSKIWDVYKVNQTLGGNDSNHIVEEYTISDNHIWATNATKIYSSDDGITWQEFEFTSQSLSSSPYQSYYNGTDNMAAITNYPTKIHKTTDAGNDWSYHQSGENGTNLPDGIYFYFIDHNRYLAYNFFGSNSKIYRSDDGGLTFSEENLIDIPLGIYSKNNNSDVIFIYGKNGMLYKTTNQGGLSVKKDTDPNKKIKIYPNPAEEKIILEYDDGLSIQSVQLLDVSGKIIRTYDANFREIDIRNIMKGSYLLVIKTKNERFTEKIIVK